MARRDINRGRNAEAWMPHVDGRIVEELIDCTRDGVMDRAPLQQIAATLRQALYT